MPLSEKVVTAQAFSLPGPMIVDGCRLDAMVMGPAGEMVRPHLVVIITPAELAGPFVPFSMPEHVDANFRAIAETMRDVLGGGR
jgi:hypothetical protein